MGVQNFVGQLAYLISPWFLLIMQYDPLFDGLVRVQPASLSQWRL